MSLDSILRSVGKNLFDKTASERGWLFAETGKILTNTVDYTSGFIPIENLKTYFCTGTSVQNWACLYDENKNFLSPYLHGTGSTGSFSLTINNPKAKYMRITMPNVSESDLGTVQVELGSTATSYEPYHQGPETINTGDKEVLKVSYGSRNLWQNTNTTFPSTLSYDSNTQTYTTGTGTAGYNFVAHTLTNPIPVGTTVTISIMFQSGKGKSVCIGGYHRTGAKSWQGHIDVPKGTDMTGQTLTGTFTTTETVEEFMVFHNTGDNIEEPFVFQVQYELGDKATEYVPYSREVVWTKTFITTDVLGNFELGKSVLA